jgi:sugar phosphate isomerase/epimerase
MAAYQATSLGRGREPSRLASLRPSAPRNRFTRRLRGIGRRRMIVAPHTQTWRHPMPANIKGPAIFLAQFAGDNAPFNSWPAITRWAASLGFKGVQVPSWDKRLFDLERAAESRSYCDEFAGVAREQGVAITELSTHLQGQLVAVHPAYDEALDAFAPPALHGKPAERQRWAVEQLKLAARASRNLGLSAMVSFPGALAWPYLYPWPQRPPGLIERAFDELARRWRPIFDAFDEAGCDVCFELHPGEDLFDGVTFEMLLERVDQHPRLAINYDPSHFVLQQLDYLEFIDIYHSRIKALHIKDAEFRPNGRQGVYSGYQPWLTRAGRFRSLGDGQIDFGAVFSKFAQYNYASWAVLEWECCLKHPEDGAAEGARFIRDHIIRVTERAFDDFAGGATDTRKLDRMLGLSRS